MAMTEKLIDKNFGLSLQFMKYSLKHPEVTKIMTRGAHLIFEDTSDPTITKANRKLAKESLREGAKCFRAIKDGRRWSVEPIAK